MNAQLSQQQIDAALEAAIERAYEEMLKATDDTIAREHFLMLRGGWRSGRARRERRATSGTD